MSELLKQLREQQFEYSLERMPRLQLENFAADVRLHRMRRETELVYFNKKEAAPPGMLTSSQMFQFDLFTASLSQVKTDQLRADCLKDFQKVTEIDLEIGSMILSKQEPL